MIGFFIFVFIRVYGFFLVFLRCLEWFYDEMVVVVLKVLVLFFDLNLVGRIFN